MIIIITTIFRCGRRTEPTWRKDSSSESSFEISSKSPDLLVKDIQGGDNDDDDDDNDGDDDDNDDDDDENLFVNVVKVATRMIVHVQCTQMVSNIQLSILCQDVFLKRTNDS